MTGVLVYALILRLRLPRWLATAGAAVVVLDAYAIALEQQILAEAFFTLALVASFYLVVGRDRDAGVAGRGRAAARARRDDAHRRAVRGAGVAHIRAVVPPLAAPRRAGG